MFHFPEIALAASAIGLIAYELYHQYGSFGFGNPYNQGNEFGGYGASKRL